MQKMDRNKDPLIFELQFNQVKNFTSWSLLFIPIIFISLVLYSFKLYQLVNPEYLQSLKIPYFSIFLIQIIFLSLAVVLIIVSFVFKTFHNLYGYSLLLMESIGLIYVECTMQCFSGSTWCEGQSKYQAGSVMLLVAYGFLILLKSYYYYPFYDNYNYLSMTSGSIVLLDFTYKIALGYITNSSVFESLDSQRKFVVILTVVLYLFYVGNNNHCNPLINSLWILVYTFIAWTSVIAYILPYLDVFSTMNSSYVGNTNQLFWYIWGYSFPCMLIYSLVSSLGVNRKQAWKTLFLQKKHQIKKMQHLYLMLSQLKHILNIIKKSQQKVNDQAFKLLWKLIEKHNQFCDHAQCPLAQLKNIRITRTDDHQQQKRLAKTIQTCYSFGIYHAQRKKDRHPNLLPLSIQIVNYELDVFQNRQKGLLLYNKFAHSNQVNSNQKFALFYLKKKVQQLFVDNQNVSKVNKDNEISQFRHNIEVSVSMLAQFWYFLADPKCNLKKLYDLANVLFPLKIGVDNQWKIIQKLKNIQSYHLYARYLIKMFNDKEKGMKILEEAKKIQQQVKNRQQVQIDTQGNSNIGVEQNGIIFLQFDGKNPGVMYQVNLAAQRIFGYNKGQLVNRKVNDIMPKIIANHHDRILQNYQQTNKSKMMNKERVVWGKSKDGYLFPFSILIKPVKNMLSQSSQVYASLKRDLWVKQTAFLVLDLNDQISEVSSAMLGIYPQLYGKVNLKKKMHITQIIPNFMDLKSKMLEEKQSCSIQVTRSFSIGQEQKYSQITVFSISLDDISITVAGSIGLMLKFQRTIMPNNQKDLALSNIRQSKLPGSNFNFIYQVVPRINNDSRSEIYQQGQGQMQLKFKGGIVYNSDQMAKSCLSSVNKYFLRNPIKEEKIIQQRKQKFYGQDIKTKRLEAKGIREVVYLSQQSQFDQGEAEKQIQEMQGQGNIRPSELSSILQKQTSNKNIFALKIITFLILFSASLLYIIQYVSTLNVYQGMKDEAEKIRSVNQLSAQILYMKMYTVKFSRYLRSTEQLNMMKQQINLYGTYLTKYNYGKNTKLFYSDGTNQTMLLGFALNKLTSQANSLLSYSTILDSTNSNTYFVNYNTINGILVQTFNQILSTQDMFLSDVDKISDIEIMFLAVAISFFVVALIIKNIFLRIVLKKKAQILEVFFQIPRKACTSIQKQCQRFIQRLSSENQQDIEIASVASQTSDIGLNSQDKKRPKQKKRTVMGQQKTTKNFVIATVGFLLILLFFHIFILSFYNSGKEVLTFSLQTSSKVFQLQKQFALVTNIINSYALDPNIPLKERPLTQSLEVIKKEFQLLKDIYAELPNKFYLIGTVFDSAYLNSFNELQYNDLCARVGKDSTQCSNFFGQNLGLNVVVSQYMTIVTAKYNSLMSFAADGVISSTQADQILDKDSLVNERIVQYLLKEHWRSLTLAFRDGFYTLINSGDTIAFALMLTMCIVNFTILLIGWLKYYQNLQQKIAATEYILTFIPIDQINRNPKIANYIKQQILQKR